MFPFFSKNLYLPYFSYKILTNSYEHDRGKAPKTECDCI